MTNLQVQTEELYQKLQDYQSGTVIMEEKLEMIHRRMQELLQEKHDLEREIADAERRERTHRLIEIGAEYVRVFHSYDVEKARAFFERFVQRS